MKCNFCRKEAIGGIDGIMLCEDCQYFFKTHIGMRCEKCGDIGFIHKNELNAVRVSRWFDYPKEFLAMVKTTDIVIVDMSQCPKCCREYHKAQERVAVC